MKQLISKINFYFKLYRYNLIVDIKTLKVYKTNFITDIIIDILSVLVTIIFYRILYFNITKIEGWEIYQLYILVICVRIINDVYGLFFARNIGSIAEKIWSGNLDFDLIKPIKLLFVLTFSRLNIKYLFNIITSVIIFILIILKFSVNINFLNFIVFLFVLGIAVFVKYSFSFIISQFSFYFIRIEALSHFFNSFFALSIFPDKIYGKNFIKYFFTFIIPVLIVGNIPLKALFNQINFLNILIIFIFSIILFTLSYVGFKSIIKKYSSASS